MRVVPPVSALLALTGMWLADRIVPAQAFPPLPYTAGALAALAATLFVWTVLLFKRTKTTLLPEGRPSGLIVEGPFRLTRNPIYVAFTLFLFSAFLWLGSLTPLLFPLLFWWAINTWVVPTEEANLERAFGREYTQYKKRVRRWV